MPGMISTPISAPARMASGVPAMVSWSVRARADIFLCLARATSSVGVKVPSEKFEWVCRSMDISEGRRQKKYMLYRSGIIHHQNKFHYTPSLKIRQERYHPR